MNTVEMEDTGKEAFPNCFDFFSVCVSCCVCFRKSVSACIFTALFLCDGADVIQRIFGFAVLCSNPSVENRMG